MMLSTFRSQLYAMWENLASFYVEYSTPLSPTLQKAS